MLLSAKIAEKKSAELVQEVGKEKYFFYPFSVPNLSVSAVN